MMVTKKGRAKKQSPLFFFFIEGGRTMKYVIWTVINTIIFMMNLALTVICALMYMFMRDDAKKRAEYREKINKYYSNFRTYEEEES